MARRGFVVLLVAALVSLLAPGAHAEPAAIEVPVSIKLTVAVPATYVLRFELSGADQAVRWAEQMDPAGPGKRVASTTYRHSLGSLWRTVPGNTALDAQLFGEQLWLRALRWVESKGRWVACSSRVKLTVVPYAAWSATSDGAGEEMITTIMIQNGAVTTDKLSAGAVTFAKLGESCPPEAPQLVYGPEGWTCGTALTCSPGDFLMCYDPGLFDRLFIGTCRPGYRPCTAEGSGFGPCAGAVLPAPDACNGLDDDCDGVPDNPADGTRLYEDRDGDGHGKAAVSRTFCPGDQPGWAPAGDDCDDADPLVFAGALEICDSKDNDCDGAIDDGCRIEGACSLEEQEGLLECFAQCAGDDPEQVGPCVQECVGALDPSPVCGIAVEQFSTCYAFACPLHAFDAACAESECAASYGLVFGRTPDCQYGQTRPCGETPNTGICHDGIEGCRSGLWSGDCQGAVFPGVEVCFNAVDEDCDGSTTDSDNVEICDGLDNDCDGNPDDASGGAVHCIVPPGAPCTAADESSLLACVGGIRWPDEIAFCFENLSQACRNAAADEVFVSCVFTHCAGGEPIFPLDPGCFTDPGLCKGPYDLLFAGRAGECFHGATGQCGPATDLGVCAYGTKTCDHGLWGECLGGVYPTPEQCEPGLDYDCDGQPAEGQMLFDDPDGDGYGSGAGSMRCPGPGLAPAGGDCDEANPEVNPGMPEWSCNDVDDDCRPETPDLVDEDGDGVTGCGGLDCDDGNTEIFPGAPELCDYRDNDCDGEQDEGCICWDGDEQGCYTGPAGTEGVGGCRGGYQICASNAWGPCIDEVLPEPETCDGSDNDCNFLVDDGPDGDADGYSACADCNDADAAVYPGAFELCDGKDNDCNSAVDDAPDGDADGYDACVDCNDADSQVNPGRAESACNGRDDDCNGATPEDPNADGDAVTLCAGDCNDTDPEVFPGAPELCDGKDNDCNGAADDAADGDGDGFNGCQDCNDADATVHPFAPELCDGKDNDCDGTADNPPDMDGDGFTVCLGDCDDLDPGVNPGLPESGCNGLDDDCSAATPDVRDGDGDGALCTTDCNDADPAVLPGAVDVCDGKDNNCDGAVDNGDADVDGVPVCMDCDDADPTIHPYHPEICDGKDNNCSGGIDDGSLCNDGDFCNGEETCGGAAGCLSGTDPCDDSDQCTTNFCNEGLDECSWVPIEPCP